jgi:hypothetical protein
MKGLASPGPAAGVFSGTAAGKEERRQRPVRVDRNRRAAEELFMGWQKGSGGG